MFETSEQLVISVPWPMVVGPESGAPRQELPDTFKAQQVGQWGCHIASKGAGGGGGVR